MNHNNHIPPGYKHSPLGLIPDDWTVTTLNHIFKNIVVGFVGIISNEYCDENNGVSFIRTLNVKDGYFDPSDVMFVSKEFHNKNKKSQIFNEDILIARVGANMGNVCKVSNLTSEANAANVIIIKKEPGVDPDFYAFFLSSEYGQSQIKIQGGGGAQAVFNTSLAYKLKVPLINETERKLISIALSTWDKAIQITAQLIAQKERRKKWLMQQLLTGKKRLKGFSGKWKEVHIRDVAEEVSIKNKDDKQHIVLSCTKYDGLVPSLEYFGRKIFADDLSTYKIVPENHFAYATNHIEEGSIGYQGNYNEALISPMYTVFKTDSSIDDYFFFKLLKSHHLIFQYNARMEGSIDRRGGLRWEAFSIIRIHIPDKEEQIAIASVLQAADKEIQLLKAKAEQLKEQKKGLMQQLLTGKKRLKILKK